MIRYTSFGTKVENLNAENQQLKTQFKNSNRNTSNFQNRPQWQANDRNFGRSNMFGKSPFSKPNYDRNSSFVKQNQCPACGNDSCSGKRETCEASDKVCYRCEKVGHYSRKCRSIRNIRGELIKQ